MKNMQYAYLCKGTPAVDVFFTEEGDFDDKFFTGKIYYPYQRNDFVFLVHDYDDQLLYKVSTPCYNKNIWCDTFIEHAKVEFIVQDAQGNKITQGIKHRKGWYDSKSYFEVDLLDEMNWI